MKRFSPVIISILSISGLLLGANNMILKSELSKKNINRIEPENKILSSHGFDIKDILKLFTSHPNSIININWEPLKINKGADIVIIDPNIEWRFNERHIFSKSKNSAFLIA